MSNRPEHAPDAEADDEQIGDQESALKIARDETADEARRRKRIVQAPDVLFAGVRSLCGNQRGERPPDFGAQNVNSFS